MTRLHAEVVGPPDGRLAVVAHGILGSGRNWRSVARRLAEALPGWRFALVDLRNHGQSPGGAPPHTVAACAADLAELAHDLGSPEVALGHSFGGKVVLAWLQAGAPLRQTWVIDSPPGPRPADPDVIGSLAVIAAVRAVPVPSPDRDRVRAALRAAGVSEPLVQWLLTSLRQEPDGWRWVWDLDGVDAMIRDYLALDLWPWLRSWDGAPVELVRAGRSDGWSAEELARLHALPAHGAVRSHLLAEAGHWVHVDAPDALHALLTARWAR